MSVGTSSPRIEVVVCGNGWEYGIPRKDGLASGREFPTTAVEFGGVLSSDSVCMSDGIQVAKHH